MRNVALYILLQEGKILILHIGKEKVTFLFNLCYLSSFDAIFT